MKEERDDLQAMNERMERAMEAKEKKLQADEAKLGELMGRQKPCARVPSDVGNYKPNAEIANPCGNYGGPNGGGYAPDPCSPGVPGYPDGYLASPHRPSDGATPCLTNARAPNPMYAQADEDERIIYRK